MSIHVLNVDRENNNTRIDVFLTQSLPNIPSHSFIKKLIDTGNVTVNKRAVKAHYKVKETQEIRVEIPPESIAPDHLEAEDIALDIIYEDDHVMVVNKQAGMVVHPGYHNYDHTLVNALMYHFENLPTANGERRPGLVHRIDKDTSGLLVIAKDEYSMSHLAKQFFEHTVIRNYVALVWGYLDEENGTITGNLARSKHDRRIMQVYEDEEIGKHAVTHYKVLERFNYATLVECTLETGRTHQIRIHMKHIRHPLFNDAAYGGNEIKDGPSFTKFKQFIDNCFSICPRQALHARTLGFVHPHTKKEMLFELPPPADMQLLIEKWRHYTSFKEREGE